MTEGTATTRTGKPAEHQPVNRSKSTTDNRQPTTDKPKFFFYLSESNRQTRRLNTADKRKKNQQGQRRLGYTEGGLIIYIQTNTSRDHRHENIDNRRQATANRDGTDYSLRQPGITGQQPIHHRAVEPRPSAAAVFQSKQGNHRKPNPISRGSRSSTREPGKRPQASNNTSEHAKLQATEK